jgi:hypothetical protein
MRISIRHSLLVLPLAIAACAKQAPPPAPPPPVVAVPPLIPIPRPIPPNKAAPNLTIPAKLADGGYATPNRGLSTDAQVWHLRVALNVAALTCVDPTQAFANDYNRLLAARKKRFDAAYKGLSKQYGSLDSLDVAMTRLYNYFAQPPAQTGFCPVARDTLTQVNAVPEDGLASFALQAVPRLDQPFLDFYAAYDQYRADLARWQAAQTPVAVAPPPPSGTSGG